VHVKTKETKLKLRMSKGSDYDSLAKNAVKTNKLSPRTKYSLQVECLVYRKSSG
jgi:hypothetical protein